MCQRLGERKFSTPLGKYQGLWPLGHMVRVCLILKEATELSSKGAVLLCTPTRNEWEAIILKHYFWGTHCKTPSNPRTEKSPFTRHNGGPILLSLRSAPSHTVYGQEPWNFPILKEKLLGEPGSVTTHDLNYAQVFKNTERSSIIKCIKQSSQPKKAVAEKKNRVWAALWEINSTAFHQVEILALDTHKNEPGLIWAPVDVCQITKVDPIGLLHHREGHCWNSRWYYW